MIKLIFIPNILLFVVHSLFSETIIIKKEPSIKGKVIDQSSTHIIVQTNNKTISIQKNSLLKVVNSY